MTDKLLEKLNFDPSSVHKHLTAFIKKNVRNRGFAKDSGVLASNIYSLNLCTKENEIFFSYRRDKETGRMISGIMFN